MFIGKMLRLDPGLRHGAVQQDVKFILPATDSAVERKLMRDVRRLGTDWILTREAEAVRAGERVFFPDFTLRRGNDKVSVEIVGFYTPQYLESKLATLRAAGLRRFVVCVDETLACDDGEIAADRVLRYRKSVDAGALIRLVDAVAAEPL